jgi:hypothetical protein
MTRRLFSNRMISGLSRPAQGHGQSRLVYVIQRLELRSARLSSLLKAVSHPTGIFPVGLAVIRSRPGATRADTFECVLVSRSPFLAALLTGAFTLAVDKPLAVSTGHAENIRQAGITKDANAATNFDERERPICMTRLPMRYRIVHRLYLLLRKFR